MKHDVFEINGVSVDGYVIPCGPCTIVMITAENGFVGCGAFDVDVLTTFEYPAVTVRSATGGRIATVDDVLSGVVVKINKGAQEKGVTDIMTGRQALELML